MMMRMTWGGGRLVQLHQEEVRSGEEGSGSSSRTSCKDVSARRQDELEEGLKPRRAENSRSWARISILAQGEKIGRKPRVSKDWRGMSGVEMHHEEP